MKALHPSDPTATVDGIPDESAIPSIHMGFQTTQTIYAPTGSTGSWGINLGVLPHPVVFSSFHSYDATNTHVYRGTHANPQLDGVNHIGKMSSWKKLAQRWRLAYMSVSVYQDAAALTNQGTVVACQYPVKPTLNSFDQGAYMEAAAGGVLEACPPRLLTNAMSWRVGDMPDFEVAQAMPNAYFGNSRDGLYMPMKLTRTCQRWRSEADCFANGGLLGCTDDGNVNVGLLGVDGGDSGMPRYVPPDFTDLIQMDGWPFWGTAGDAGYLAPATKVPFAGPPAGYAGYLSARTSEFCNDTIGSICLKNLDITTRLSIVYRVGFEIQVQPGSTLSPLQKLSPPHDELALAAYFAIAREMKDAYPVDHNDLGKIWDVISMVGKSVLPTLAPYLGPLGPVAGAALAIGDRIRRGLETGRNPPSMADRAIASTALHAIQSAPKARQTAKTAKATAFVKKLSKR